MNSKLDNNTFLYSKNGKVFSLCEKDERDFIDHSLEQCYRILLLPEGKYTATIDFKTFDIEGRVMLFAIPNQKFEVRSHCSFRSIAIAFNQEFYCIEKHDKAVSCNGFLFNNFVDQPYVQFSNIELQKIKPVLNNIKEEFPMMEMVQEEMLKTHLQHLLIIAVRNKVNISNKIAQISSEDHELVRKFNALVASYFKETHLVSDYASKLFLTPEQLSRKLKQLTNRSPIEIIHERIILEAKRKLKYSSNNIKEVAYNLGFSDAAYFSKVFKKNVGVSPKKFKSEI